MNRSLEDALKSLSSSGLMTEQEIRQFLDNLPFDSRPSDSDSLWSRLLEEHLLTRFQVDALANGAPYPLRLGDHVLLEPLGAGGMGVVFKAWNQRLERMAAVKILSADATRSRSGVARFHQEAKAAARLHHPNVVTTFDAGEEQDTHYLAMEFVDGVDLLRYVRNQGVLTLPVAAGIVVQAARGLKYAHGKGVVHRDVKPSNLLLDREGNVKILDLGLARIGDSASPRGDSASLRGDSGADDLTVAGESMGTWGYIAPEQAEDARKADARSDVYALGCTLYFLLTGRTIASGTSRGSSDVLQAHPPADTLSLRDARPDASPEFEAVFKRMVASRPEERFSTMAEVIVALEPFRGATGTDESRVLLDIPTTDQTPPRDATDPHGPRRASTVRPEGSQLTLRKGTAAASPPRRRWSRWGVPGAVAVLLLVAVGLAIGPVASGLRAGLTGDQEEQHLTDAPNAEPTQEDIHIPPKRISEPNADGLPVVVLRMFGRQEALELQNEIAEFLGVEREFANSIGMSLAIVPPHRIKDEESGDTEITPPIYVGVYEVTQQEYQRVMGGNPSAWVRGGKFEKRITTVEDTTRFPVDSITLEQAEEFCKRLTELPAESAAGRVYRLPTGDEWHVACRAGEGDIHPDLVSEFAWNDLNSGIPGVIDTRRPHTVGMLKPNAFGMYDMLGNLGEMSSDRMAGRYRAVGSNFDQMAMYQNADRDHWTTPERPLNNRGFRVVCTTPEMRRYATPEQSEP